MKFKKLCAGVELPEKYDSTRWINVRANERIDVCSGDQIRVKTGVHVTVAKNETVKVVGGGNVVETSIVTGELFVTIHNPDKRNYMIYPSMIIAEILVEKQPVKASVRKPSTRKPRKARLTSQARLIKNESNK